MNRLKTALRILLPLALTVLVLWYLFHIVNFSEMMKIITSGVDYWWILLAMVLSIFSHIIRAARWRLQLDSLDVRPPFMALCCSIFGCYALNLVFPRLGDIWRCTYIAKREKAPLTKVFGSMVSDRLSDSVAVLVLLVLTFILAGPALEAFLEKYPVGREMINFLSSPEAWMLILCAGGIFLLLLRLMRGTRLMTRLRESVAQLWEGFASVIRMRGRGRFILLTVLLWGCYYIQLYVAFFAFPFTRELCGDASLGFGLLPCLVAFVFSSIGMAIPSNGGLGPWNIAIMFGLAIYGIPDAEGTAFSMLQWSGQTVMLILLGLFTIGYIVRDRR